MFLHFTSRTYFVVKIFLNSVNVITGDIPQAKIENGSIDRQKQDYVVVPNQRWIDGVAIGGGKARQFVAGSNKGG